MPSTSSQQTAIATTLAIAILGLFFFTKKVVRAKAALADGGHHSSRPCSPRNGGGGGATAAGSSSGKGGGAGSGGGDGRAMAFAVGLLDIAIPRDDRVGGSFPRVMINDACIARAVKEVSRQLVVSLRDADNMPAGVVRAYVSGLYQEVYDAACAADRPDLDVRVLLPATGTSGAGTAPAALPDGDGVSLPSPFTFNPGPPPEGGGGGGGPLEGGREFTVDLVRGWASREVAVLEPELEVLFSDDPPDDGRRESINTDRQLAGYPALRFVGLESVASGAHTAEYFYAEDVLASIPTFSSVACGGTFDRLHGGHKKLLTLAASMCEGGTLTVGVTSDSMLKAKSNAKMLSSLPERLAGVTDFLRTLNPQMRTRVEGITDPFGPPAVEEAFDAIVVSSETVLGAEKINELRAQKGFRPLAVAVTRRLAAATLSSSYLRRAAEEKQRDMQQQQQQQQQQRK
ncbi:unnamed protein product [Ectocarpus sp. 6 AP-2014]